MKRCCLLLTCYLFFYALAWTFADTPKSHPDSHAPIGVMGDHGHKTGELMLSYRFMAMDMQGLQFGTTAVESSELYQYTTENDMETHPRLAIRLPLVGTQ